MASSLKRNRVGHRALHSALITMHKSFTVNAKGYAKKQRSKKKAVEAMSNRSDLARRIKNARQKSGKSGIHSAG